MTQAKKNRHKAGRAAPMRTDLVKPKRKYAAERIDAAKKTAVVSKAAQKRAVKAAEKAARFKRDEALRGAEKTECA